MSFQSGKSSPQRHREHRENAEMLMNENETEQNIAPPPKKRGLFLCLLRLWYVRVPCEIGLLLLVWSFVIQFRPTSGASMLPTLQTGAYVFVDKLSYNLRMPRRGEVIMIESNEQPPMFYCKRIIALPGEVIEIRNGLVYIDHFPLEEPYVIRNNMELWNAGPSSVPPKHFFVVGDNRGMNMDGHWHGMVSLENIRGRIIGKTHNYNQ